MMFDKLAAVEASYEALMTQLAEQGAHGDPAQYARHAKALSELEPLVDCFRKYKAVSAEIAQIEELARTGDAEMRDLAGAELKTLTERRDALLSEIKMRLVPKDPNDDRNVMLEIRAGTGGDEAGLFAADLYRMYARFAQRRGWAVKEINLNFAEITGEGAFDTLKKESGVHRVQRIPKTERAGRIHTSTATVAVLPRVSSKEIEINPAHLKIDTFRSSGHGGQNVQKVETAVRITHLPTGVTVACQDERSQIQNREKAMEIIRAKLYQMLQEQQKTGVDQLRREQVGGAERSEKIRTWNFPQDRITDHRFGVSVGNIESVLDGNLDSLLKKIGRS